MEQRATNRPGGKVLVIIRRLVCGEGGVSLASQLVALAIISVTLTIFVAALSTSSAGVLVVRRQVSAQNYARQQLEAIKDASYQASYDLVPTNDAYSLDVQVEEISDGLQKITIRVQSARQGGGVLCTLEGYKRRNP